MIRTTLNWTVKNLKTMYDEKKTLSFTHPIQRQSAQWDNEQQSLLIHSMLANFPVPAVYVHKTESIEVDAKGKHSYNYSVLDGKQRMTTVFSFINGEYALSEDIPDVEIEDVTYEIAGKYFEDLDEDVQQSDDMCTLLQGMMLLDNKYRDYDFSSISADEVMTYSQYIKNNYPDECKDRLKKIIGFLDNVFYMKDKNLKKINIPILFLIADKALAESITGTNFRRWYNSFFDEHKEEYNQYCSSGSIKKEKTLGRIEVMSRCFEEYFRELNKESTLAESTSETESTSSNVASNVEEPAHTNGADTVPNLEDTPVSDNADKEISTVTDMEVSSLVETSSAEMKENFNSAEPFFVEAESA